MNEVNVYILGVFIVISHSPDWNVPIDIKKTNKEYIDRSEELWQAIEKARWSFWEDIKDDE